MLVKGAINMDYFKTYSSNTYAGSSNQLYFNMNDGEIRRGMALYKISAGGKYNYSLLFSNVIDSTFSDGSISQRNMVCESWNILGAKIGKVESFSFNEKISEITVQNPTELTFNGSKTKKVAPGEFFSSDPIELEFKKGEYLCFDITFSGGMIPYHEEVLIPVYIREKDDWSYSKKMPLPGMVGCDRKVKGRIVYFGDSITQGIGTEINSYEHWNAKLSEKTGEEFSYWNLGIGYGRANDAASGGAWLYKAMQSDVAVVCFGVNDILQGKSERQIKSDLNSVADKLNSSGVKVILQTVPPFNYVGADIEKWNNINRYIKTVLKKKVFKVFDVVPYLSKSNEEPHMTKFGGHPDKVGCSIWADALYDFLKREGTFI